MITFIAVSFAIFHLYTGMFGSFPPHLQRPIHLTFAVVLAFLFNVPQKSRKKRFWTFFDIIFSVVALVVFGYFIWQNEVISEWIPFVTPFGDTEFFVAVIASLLLLEATRRVAGLPFAIVVAIFLLYGRFGAYFPGVLKHTGFSWNELMEFLYFGLNGVYGIPIGVSATFIVMFIIFGCFFEKAGGGKAIMDFGKYAIGHMRGGPAKIAVVTSALFGIISGSGVANVYATGTLSIPLMKKLGYKPSFAAAVEACASTGGQLMPPVMGAAAFIMAEITGIPYVRILGAALIPALLYFTSIFFMVDFEAARLGISGLPRKELPTLRDVLPYAYLVIPLVVLVWLIIQGFSIMRAGLFATFATIAVSWIRKGHELNINRIIETLNLAGRRTVMIAVATAAAGIVVGVVTLTGMGLNFVGLVLGFSGEFRVWGVILTAIATLILGMGVATTVAYIIVTAVAVPALLALGFDLLPSHMFAFYFAVISLISPPVAPSSLAASAIATSSFFRTGLIAVKLGIVSFLIPFMFIYSPELLMYGNAWEIIKATIISLSAVIALSAGVHGWFLMNLNFFERSILIGGAFILICHKIITIFSSNCFVFMGFTLLIFVIGWLVIKRKKLTNKER
jgi:TRAP transporter 4TM/12TM fusion protein